VLICGVFSGVDCPGAQPPATGSGAPPARDSTAAGRSNPQPETSGRGSNAARGKDQTAPAPQAQATRREPSPAYRDSLRKTLEKRRQRRARLAQGQGLDGARPIGAIVPWPMPPALIIRHTPEVHGEVDSLVGRLRK
jgi:hypothetical protein